MRLLTIFLTLTLGLSAQTTKVSLSAQTQTADFSGFSYTRPVAVVSSLPGTCSIYSVVWLTTAPAGQNLYGCTSSNTWTQLSGVSGGVTSITTQFPTSLFGASGCNETITTTGTINCQFATGQTANTVLASNSSGAVGFTSITTAMLPSATVFNNQSNTFSSGLQDFSSVPFRPETGASTPGTCAVGQVFFNTAATAGQNWYFCTATNTWTQQLNSGGSLPWTTLGDTLYYTGSAAARLAGPTAATTYVLTEAGTGSAAQAPSWTAAQFLPTCSSMTSGVISGPCITSTGASGFFTYINNQTGTGYTIPATAAWGLITFNNASAVSVALPQAGSGSNFPAGTYFDVTNYGAGQVTVTATTSNIGPTTNVRIIPSATGSGSSLATHSCRFVSDGTNYGISSCN